VSELLPIQADSIENAPRKKYPPGVILDKNGKPCKSCTTFRDLISFSKKQPTIQQLQQPSHCPPDVEVLGRATWTFLHTLAANFPEHPTVQEQQQISSFMWTLGRFYPCWQCADDFRAWMGKRGNEIRAGSRREFEEWMCRAHNEVNLKLGKKEFDCGAKSLAIRWRDGPKDGSCG